MARIVKPGSQMSVKELKLAEEKYKMYMEGKRKRIWPLSFSMKLDIDHSIDALRYAVEQIKNIKLPDISRNPRIVIGGSSHGKTAFIESIMKDLCGIGLSFHVNEWQSGSIEQTHIPFDRLTWEANFEGSMLKDLGELVILPQKTCKDPLDETENWLSPEPPKQKKYRAHQPDKRAINRRNRKSKRK